MKKATWIWAIVLVLMASVLVGAESREYDIVIVGGGGAGLSAAVEASSAGASVVVLEKMPYLGGSSLLCGGGLAFAGTDMQAEEGVEDSNEDLFNELMEVGGYQNDPALVQAYIDLQLDTYHWLKDLGVIYNFLETGGGMKIRRMHRVKPAQLIDTLAKAAKENGATILTNVAGKRLVRDSATNRVTAVIAEENGKEVVFTARKGVILATGGFSLNPELLGKFVPAMANAKATVGPGSHGDGLLMGWALGADLKDMPYIKATYGQYPEGNNPNAREMVYYAGAIIVNKAGERFVDESINYKAIGDVALLQDDGVTYQIYDEKIRQYAHETRTRMGILEGEGMVCEADTLEELAAKVGISPSGLVATVEEYNKSIKQNGYDTKFNRTGLAAGVGDLLTIDEPPYYAFPSTGVILGTYCGLAINDKAQVIDVFGEPIDGLYAAGEVTGGFHGSGYMSGTALGKAVIFGRIAAKELTKN